MSCDVEWQQHKSIINMTVSNNPKKQRRRVDQLLPKSTGNMFAYISVEWMTPDNQRTDREEVIVGYIHMIEDESAIEPGFIRNVFHNMVEQFTEEAEADGREEEVTRSRPTATLPDDPSAVRAMELQEKQDVFKHWV